MAITYAEMLARNIRVARAAADIRQQALAERMRNLGYSAWLHQTVASVERAKRRVTAEEVFALAVCLDTTVQHLMSPLPQDDPVELPSGLSLAVGQARSLVFGHGPTDDRFFPNSSIQGATDLRGIVWDGNSPTTARS